MLMNALRGRWLTIQEMARDREISERLWLLCDTAIEGEPENVQALLSEISRDELEAVAAEARVDPGWHTQLDRDPDAPELTIAVVR